ncbi:MAG: 3-oxoacyl-[acyl-carrier-protein] synthase 3 protein 1 [Chlamydiia bacterium]|nr:3-oxoacyl-[acyl-carrier-protein] synthase 3 protein 1 [Chlamydiia bacterium]MCH9618004.1 3-oxoacyl-[acyl-carrier-protein] synthase 3 protein 1 [Chlamydiia bacterium]MCH9623671.1 3-oxoacyl-[acyl-carrier-protein] synthase 3 protein 1 [Chlamydiia bacterium]
MTEKKIFIRSTGSYLPEKVLTNKMLKEMVDTTDEWIVSRTGIKERRIALENECTSDLGVKAALKALAGAKILIEEIDLIIVATLSPDYIFPSTACMIQKKLGATCPAFDVGAACSGMLFALSSAKSFIASGQYKNVLVVAAEKVSSFIDYTDRSTCVLFGDGAAAMIVSDKAGFKESLQVGEIVLGSDGQMHKSLEIPAGGSVLSARNSSTTTKDHFLKMDGKVVFKHAIQRMASSIKECLDQSDVSEQQIDYFIPHQANDRIIDALLKRFSIKIDRVHKTLESTGNTCAASIGICLDHYLDQKVKMDQNILLTTFGAGFTWGSMLLKRERQ